VAYFSTKIWDTFQLTDTASRSLEHFVEMGRLSRRILA